MFPDSEMSCHMSVFPTRTYKKAHRHGPGRVIVIPGGEGYSILWEEGKERIVCPWHEGSMFVPPNKWFHQHFRRVAQLEEPRAPRDERRRGDERGEHGEADERGAPRGGGGLAHG
jgi:hypothetical protein